MTENPRCRLYVISPPQIVLAEFLPQVKDAFSGGDIGAFQLRLKDTSDADILNAAEKIIPVCCEYGAAFIMNDRPDLAKACHADGLHIGQEDGSVKDARAIVGEDVVIGVSCKDSRHLAMDAGEAGADYVAFGAFYETTAKKDVGKPIPEILEWWSTFTVLPSVAIGGITPANCGVLVQAGADFIAAISAVWNHPKSPADAVSEFNRSIDEATPTT